MAPNTENQNAKTQRLLRDLLEEGEATVASLKKDLKAKFNVSTDDDLKSKFKVSDVVDKEGHQYVNLVQEGGGILGIALLGYTYVLERMGIRFLKLAGTSAGAINATMMAALRPESTDTIKSPIVLYYLAEKNLFDLVDGHPIAKWLLKNQINYKNFIKSLFKSILFVLLTSISLILISSLLLWGDRGTSILAVLVGIIVAFLLAIVLFGRGAFSDGIVSSYLSSRYFLKIFASVAIILGVAYGLSIISPVPLYISLRVFAH